MGCISLVRDPSLFTIICHCYSTGVGSKLLASTPHVSRWIFPLCAWGLSSKTHKTGKVWTRDAAVRQQRHLPRKCWAILPNFTWIVVEKTIWPRFDSLLPSLRKTTTCSFVWRFFSTSWGGFSVNTLTIYIPHASARGSSSKAPPWWTSQQAMRRVRGCTYVYSDKYSMY